MKTKLKLLILIPVLCLALPTSGLAICKTVQDQDETWSGGKSPDCWRNGKRHGQWEWRFADGQVDTGPYVDGKEHGQWEIQRANGGVDTGPYVDGKKHGQWEIQYADGGVATGPYVNGKAHGQWEIQYADGRVDTGPYVDGRRHGQWEIQYADGGVATGPYVDGRRHGQWEIQDAYGWVATGPYVNGKRQGQWKRQNRRFTSIGLYVDGKAHGEWRRVNHSGDVRSISVYKHGDRISHREIDAGVASTTGNSKGGNSWLDVLAGGVLLNEVSKGNLSAKDALKLQKSFLNPSGGGGLGALGGGSQIATGQASDASGEACERAIRKAEQENRARGDQESVCGGLLDMRHVARTIKRTAACRGHIDMASVDDQLAEVNKGIANVGGC